MSVRTFPLTLADFWLRLPVSEIAFDLGEAMENNRTAGGQQMSADLGERLWQGRVTLGRLTQAEADEVEPLIELLRQAGRSFIASDLRRPAPRIDPAGAFIGSAAVTMTAVSSDRRQVTLAGAPAGYVLSRGDYIGFSYGSGPVRHALHRLVETVTANASGVFPAAEVVPAVRLGTTPPHAVTLVHPFCKAVIVPGSFAPGRARRGLSEGLSFSFVQSLR